MITIYGLVDPCTDCIMYIGKSKQPNRRLQEHIVLKDGTLKTLWMKRLRREGKRPGLVIIAVARSMKAADTIEQFWIASIRASGAMLLNMSDGQVPAATMHRRPRPKQLLSMLRSHV